MAIVRPDEQRASVPEHNDDSHTEALTIEDIYASTGKGTPPDTEEGVFHATTEDFIAAMQARRFEAAQ